MAMLHNFNWNNKNSLEFGVVIKSATPYNAPEHDTENVEIPGRNGDLLKDNGRYKNIEISYECAVIPKTDFADYNSQMQVIKNWLYSGGINRYIKLVDSYNPNLYRQAILSGGIDVKHENIYEFTIAFDCQPQLYYTDGDSWLDFSVKTLSLINPSKCVALPKIVISGNASTTTLSDTITIDNTVYRFNNWTGINSNNSKNYLNDIILDAEIMDCYLSDGTPCNRYLQSNGTTPNRFIELGEGKHTVSHTGNCTVKIQPRWWTI